VGQMIEPFMNWILNFETKMIYGHDSVYSLDSTFHLAN